MDRLLEGQHVLVLAEDLYEDLELWYPVLRLREEGAQVTIAGTGATRYTGKHGYPVTVDTDVRTLSGERFDALVVPGGYAPDRLRRHAEVTRLVAEMTHEGRVVAAICHAAWVLISAGILKGRRVTCFSAIKDDVINAGADYRDEEVVRDGTLITSRKPADLGAFCREIIMALSDIGR